MNRINFCVIKIGWEYTTGNTSCSGVAISFAQCIMSLLLVFTPDVSVALEVSVCFRVPEIALPGRVEGVATRAIAATVALVHGRGRRSASG